MREASNDTFYETDPRKLIDRLEIKWEDIVSRIDGIIYCISARNSERASDAKVYMDLGIDRDKRCLIASINIYIESLEYFLRHFPLIVEERPGIITDLQKIKSIVSHPRNLSPERLEIIKTMSIASGNIYKHYLSVNARVIDVTYRVMRSL